MDFMSPQSFVPQAAAPVAKIGKWKASKMVVRESWTLLKKDKEILWFPILSAILVLAAYVVIGAVYFFYVLNGSFASLETADYKTDYVSYAFLFVSYIISFLIVNFFQAGIMIIVHGRFNGQDLGFGDGIRGASDKIGKIFVWSIISATVGIILAQISNRSKTLGKIVAALFGAAWTILTFFSLPALVIGNATIKESFLESASVIRKTWGETIIVSVGVGLFFALLIIAGFVLVLIASILFGDLIIAIVLGVLFVLYIIVLAVISSALSSIFKLALYEYAKTGNVPQGFSQDLIQNAIVKK
ncbi:MAG: DUF6159 family protein [bacterium]|nr:DUF6159 family protein [bacterium]